MEERSHRCPICSVKLRFIERYPSYLCEDCAGRVASRDGRMLKIENMDLGGGCQASFSDSGEPYNTHVCFVDGVRCRADEAKFGGIVVQAIEQENLGVMDQGYVYVLAVRDIELPVCKIGMTRRDPQQRCAEINKGSTGDFLWKVHWSIHVSNCRLLEARVHQTLSAFRQKGREFFGLTASEAAERVQEMAENSADLEIVSSPERVRRQKIANHGPYSARHAEYAGLLDAFNEVFACRGRPFGQLSRPTLGISDGVEGVQWNLVVNTVDDQARLGVNLEGMRYRDWPVRRLILGEIEHPMLFEVASQLDDPSLLEIHFRRDAWQVAARPAIREVNLGVTPRPLSTLSREGWSRTLEEALTCLDSDRDHRARARATVTRLATGAQPEREDEMEVSPHLHVSTEIDRSLAPAEAIRSARERLQRIHEWAKTRSSS